MIPASLSEKPLLQDKSAVSAMQILRKPGISEDETAWPVQLFLLSEV